MDNHSLVHAVKIALRTRKITYRDLAQKLDLTESAIKKMFAVGDMTLSRLSAICDLLDISLSGLVSISENLPQKKVDLTFEQADFFAKNPSYFFFYLRVAHERDSVEKIAEDSNLNEKSVWKYLKKLDDLGLIKLQPGNSIVIERQTTDKISTQSEVLNPVRRQMALGFLEDISDENLNRDLQLYFLKLTSDTKESLRKELSEVLNKYSRLSGNQVAVIGKDELQTFTLLCGFRDNTFAGPISNIT